MENKDFLTLAERFGTPLFVYDGDVLLQRYNDLRRFITHPRLMYTPEACRWPTAFAVAEAASVRMQTAREGTAFIPEDMVPVYLRKTQAEREREERLALAENGE